MNAGRCFDMLPDHTSPDPHFEEVEVVIVGAGPAGLAVAASLRPHGIPFLILEQAAEVGSRWRQHYERLHLHTAKETSALPYMPFPADYPRYVSRQQFIDYLVAYANHFQLAPRFNQTVTSVQRVGDVWETQTADGCYRSRVVVLATGFNRVPYSPTWSGQDQFKGVILHSSQYKNGAAFRGQKALVIGFGNSGAEIAVDLFENGAITNIAVRSPVNVVSRDTLGIIPSQWLSILFNPLPAWLADSINAPIVRLKFGNLRDYGLQKLPYGAITEIRTKAQIPVIDPGIMHLIKQKQVAIRPGVDHFMEHSVVFTDGSAEALDVVILATGYRTQLADMLPKEYPLLDKDGHPLTSGTPTAAPGLYFCGLHNSAVGLLYKISRESRLITRHIIHDRYRGAQYTTLA